MGTLLILAKLETQWACFVEKTGSCWVWKGNVNKSNGYPEVNVKVAGKWVTKRLTRLVCEAIHGDLTDLEACHTCHNKKCVRPQHLVPGTRLKNMHDKIENGTTNSGERNPQAKLSAKDVEVIRAAPNTLLSRAALSHKYKVGKNHIYCIQTKRAWN